MLAFDWDEVDGQDVTDIVGRKVGKLQNGTTEADRIAIVLGDRHVEISVNIDTDELRVALMDREAPRGWTQIAALADHIGRPLGWAWEGKNHRGYADVFLVSFSGTPGDRLRTSPLDPDVLFIGCASAVQISRLRKV